MWGLTRVGQVPSNAKQMKPDSKYRTGYKQGGMGCKRLFEHTFNWLL
jgi:hypothetical protein